MMSKCLLLRVGVFALGVAWCLILTRDGMAVSPDSGNYLAGAQSLCEDFRYLGTDGQPITYWPPGYAAAPAVFHCSGASLLPGQVLERTSPGINCTHGVGVGPSLNLLDDVGDARRRQLRSRLSTGTGVAVARSELLFVTSWSAQGSTACQNPTTFGEKVRQHVIRRSTRDTGRGFAVAGSPSNCGADLHAAAWRERTPRVAQFLRAPAAPLIAFGIRNMAHGLPPLGLRGPSGLATEIDALIRPLKPWAAGCAGTIANSQMP